MPQTKIRKIETKSIAEKIKFLLNEIAFNINPKVLKKLKWAIENESCPIGREVLKDILKNADIAQKENLPLCQDTGTVQIVLEIGQNVILEGAYLEKLVNDCVISVYKNSYLRKSTCHPLSRENYKNNSPASIEYKITKGHNVTIKVLAKGGGCDNTSQLLMLKPGTTEEELITAILKVIDKAGPNACPPYFIGIAIGGTFESVAKYAKHALLEMFSPKDTNSEFYEEEIKLNKLFLKKARQLGIGPLGFGGNNTALKINVKLYPSHIASLPVAININCHSFRYQQIII